MNKTIFFTSFLSLSIIFSCSRDFGNEFEEAKNSKTQFTLLSPTRTGIEFQNTITETATENHLVNDMLISGGGVAVGDINNDQLPDLYFTGNQVEDRLYLNKGNLEFEDITDEAGILVEQVWSSGATWADVNGDGFQDLYVSKYVYGKEQLSENLFYINNGDLTFSEKSAEYGLSDRGFAVQTNFFDFDKDGDLDAYLVNQPPSMGNRKGNSITLTRLKSLLYTDKTLMNKDGKFIDMSAYSGVNNIAFGLSATVGDFNNDGWPDIYVANDYERPDYLYMNQANLQFKNTINTSIKHISNFSMGVDIADFDNDGHLDIIVADMAPEDHVRIKTNMGGMNPADFWSNVEKGYHYQYMFNTLQRNNGNGTFSEIGQLAGVSSTDWSWSALFADFDNDGWKDLFITNGVKRAMRNSDLDLKYKRVFDSLRVVAKETGKTVDDLMGIMDFVDMSPTEKLPNYIFKNNGDLTFSKKMKDWGFETPTLSFGSAYADLDLDGDIDLIINNTDEFAYIYRNNAVEKGIGNYLELRLTNKQGTPYYGVRAKIYDNDEFWQMGELTNVRGYKSKSDDIIHFGLGNKNKIEKLEVLWPSGKVTIKNNIDANQILELEEPNKSDEYIANKKNTLFKSVTNDLKIAYKHQENEFDDYAKEVLLPHKMSNFGPGLAVGDVNNDGLEDFFIGGAIGFTGKLYTQQKDGAFSTSYSETFKLDDKFEDIGAEFLDYDLDGDLDLYVVSGGNEYEPNSPLLRDRLYSNDGKGNFIKTKGKLPNVNSSGSKVVPADYDNDGDLDLFIGGRLLPGNYPLPTKSYLLRNDGGKYTDITNSNAPELNNLGLVTDATWSDFNKDGYLDLVIVGEWMPVTFMENQAGKFINKTKDLGFEKSTGWYYSIISDDFDNDGDEDFMVGNLGLNYKYKASIEEPFEVYAGDLDNNGSSDIVLGYHEHGEIFPVRGKSCSTQQIPSLAETVPTFSQFANSNIRDLYGSAIDDAIHYKAYTFASSYIQNNGDGTFTTKSLQNKAQFSSINNIISQDFDQDGNLDVIISGNLYAAEIETPRNDAGMGLFMKGDGKGNFNPIDLTESGFFAPHDAKDMKLIRIGKDRKQVVLIANNQFWMQAIMLNENPKEKVNLISQK